MFLGGESGAEKDIGLVFMCESVMQRGLSIIPIKCHLGGGAVSFCHAGDTTH